MENALGTISIFLKLDSLLSVFSIEDNDIFLYVKVFS